MVDDIDLIIVVVLDTSEDILQGSEAKEETMFDRIEVELKGVQQALYLSHIMSTTTLLACDTEVGDDLAHLCRLEDSTEARLHQVEDEKEQAIEALNQVKEESLKKCWVA
jgi:hypothetical protein